MTHHTPPLHHTTTHNAQLRRRHRGPLVALVVIGALALTACAPIVPMEPAPDAVNPECAEMIVRLPAQVADLDIRQTNAQATGAWGQPAAVLLRCGVQPIGPTTLQCLNINGIDWIEDTSDAPMLRYQAYGRIPATEVVIDSEQVSGSTVLIDLGGVISLVPQTRKCVGPQDLAIPPPSE